MNSLSVSYDHALRRESLQGSNCPLLPSLMENQMLVWWFIKLEGAVRSQNKLSIELIVSLANGELTEWAVNVT